MLTHEFLAMMLGVGRSGVQRAGLIQYKRRYIRRACAPRQWRRALPADWLGAVEISTRLDRIGSSSVETTQSLFLAVRHRAARLDRRQRLKLRVLVEIAKIEIANGTCIMADSA
jgi:hypothetical protein